MGVWAARYFAVEKFRQGDGIDVHQLLVDDCVGVPDNATEHMGN